MTQPDLLALLDSPGHPAGGFSTKDGALDAFEEMRGQWVAQAREVARRVCAERGEVTADDLHARFPVPTDENGNRLIDGRIFGAVLRSPHFVLIGYRKSRRAECHRRPIGVFQLCGAP